jgi:uncharacterized integral membrane protein
MITFIIIVFIVQNVVGLAKNYINCSWETPTTLMWGTFKTIFSLAMVCLGVCKIYLMYHQV